MLKNVQALVVSQYSNGKTTDCFLRSTALLAGSNVLALRRPNTLSDINLNTAFLQKLTWFATIELYD
jgi:hypothetical protein